MKIHCKELARCMHQSARQAVCCKTSITHKRYIGLRVLRSKSGSGLLTFLNLLIDPCHIIFHNGQVKLLGAPVDKGARSVEESVKFPKLATAGPPVGSGEDQGCHAAKPSNRTQRSGPRCWIKVFRPKDMQRHKQSARGVVGRPPRMHVDTRCRWHCGSSTHVNTYTTACQLQALDMMHARLWQKLVRGQDEQSAVAAPKRSACTPAGLDNAFSQGGWVVVRVVAALAIVPLHLICICLLLLAPRHQVRHCRSHGGSFAAAGTSCCSCCCTRLCCQDRPS